MIPNNTFQTLKISEDLSSINYDTVSAETLHNFKFFNAVFKTLDSKFFNPRVIAFVVTEVVTNVVGDGSEEMDNDLCDWYDNQVYFQIRHMVDMQKLLYASKHNVATPFTRVNSDYKLTERKLLSAFKRGVAPPREICNGYHKLNVFLK